MGDGSEPQVSRDWAWPGPGNLHGAAQDQTVTILCRAEERHWSGHTGSQSTMLFCDQR